MEKERIVLIGSGNVATHLGLTLVKNNFPVIQVYSNSLKNAKALGSRLNTNFTNNLKELTHQGSIYIICVKDDAIEKVLNNLEFTPKLLIHTSGCTHLSKLKNRAIKYGVVYPLQTFSKEKSIDFYKIPFFVEGNSKETEKKLLDFSRKLSSNVSLADSNQRGALHLAAVFSCNFVNFMCTLGSKLLKNNNLDFNLLHPLIEETVNKVLSSNTPFQFQTGPAIREDNLIMKAHLAMLKDPELKLLYSKISELIVKEKISLNEL